MFLGYALPSSPWWAAVLVAVSSGLLPARANAIPLWAHEYGVTCQKCHSVVPHLNAFGLHFAAGGYRIPRVSPGPAFPVSVKVNLVASSQYQGSGPDGAGLPKAIVDEVELLTAGLVGTRGDYFVEQYAVDGGEPGLLREGWLNYRAGPWASRTPVFVQAGLMTLPLPVDPETFRETYEHYALFDQTIGTNPFNFFDPKGGIKVSAGNPLHGTSAQIFAGPGRDRQSGEAAVGTDVMEFAQHIAGPVTMSLYHYAGTRPDGANALDRFERTGWGLAYAAGKWESESVLQTGYDSSIGGAGVPSSGGFTQVRYAFGSRLFALARYDGTDDTLGGFARDAVLLAGYRPTHNSRLTIEGVRSAGKAASTTMNLQLTVAY